LPRRSFSSTQTDARSTSVNAPRLVWANKRICPAPRTTSKACLRAASEGTARIAASSKVGQASCLSPLCFFDCFFLVGDRRDACPTFLVHFAPNFFARRRRESSRSV